MTRVLHIIDRNCDETQLQALDTLRRKLSSPQAPHSIISVDPAMGRRATAHLGEDVPVAHQRLWKLMNWVPDLSRRVQTSGAKVLHAWGIDAARVCAARLPQMPMVITLLSPHFTKNVATWLRTFPRQAAIAAGSQIIRTQLIQAGVAPDQIVVIRGAADFGAINRSRSLNKRAELVGNDGPVLLLTGPATQEGGEFQAVWAAAIVAQVFPRLHLIAPYHSLERDRIRRFVDQIDMSNMLVCPDDRMTWIELVTCADVFVISPIGEVCAEPLGSAMAAGLPVVGTAVRSVAEIIADRHNGLLCKPGQPRLLAARILQAFEDQSLRKQITDVARGQAYEVFSARAFTDNYQRLYENALEGRSLAENVSDTAMIA